MLKNNKVLKEIKDWKKYLEGEEVKEIKEFQKHIRTGRPMGGGGG